MELELRAGWVEPELAAELPGLGLVHDLVALADEGNGTTGLWSSGAFFAFPAAADV